MASAAGTVLACLLVLFALVAPNQLTGLAPGSFARVPVEGLLGAALLLVLPAWSRRVLVVLFGVLLGLLTLVKIVDMGFFAVLARPFDPVFDWSFFGPGVEFLRASIGRPGAIAVVLGVVLLALAIPVLMTLSVRRLARLSVRHGTGVARGVAGLAIACVACSALGVRVVPEVPVGALAYDQLVTVRAGLADRRAYAAETAEDAFRGVPAGSLLTGLRGKDVILSFVESYGRDAIEDPHFATGVGAVLDAGTRRLKAAGYASRSAFLTSSTAGGGSWLAHSTLLSGVWINNQQRYRDLVSSDRLTLNRAFHRAGWRTVGVMPGVTRDWPEGAFYGFDRVYARGDLGYHGPEFTLSTMPDQFTLSTFQRRERSAPGHAPVMAEIPLASSHAPWTPIPRLLPWDRLGDGSVYWPIRAASEAAAPRGAVSRDPARLRTQYGLSIEYSLATLISYVETYGADNLVLVFLGDHQPAPVVTGADASRDVPVTIVARDPAVLDRISGWGWQDGLRPGPDAPVWRMSAFRDRFLTAFGSP